MLPGVASTERRKVFKANLLLGGRHGSGRRASIIIRNLTAATAHPVGPTRVILIRHGQTADTLARRLSGRRDTPLTDAGRAQAARAAAQLAASYRLGALYTSPLRRAHETAGIVGAVVGCPAELDHRLMEMHFGEIEGFTDDELRGQLPDLYAAAEDRRDLQFRWPGGESRAEFRARAREGFEEIVARHAGQVVGIVSHGGVISVILQSIDGDRTQFWRGYLLDTCHMVEVTLAPTGRHFQLLEGSCFLDVPVAADESVRQDAAGDARAPTWPAGPGTASTKMAPMPDPPPPRESAAAGGPDGSPDATPNGASETPRPNWRDRPVRDIPKKPLEAWLGEFEQRVRESDAQRAREAEERATQRPAERGPQRRDRGRRRGEPGPRLEQPAGSLESAGAPARRRRRGRGRGRARLRNGGPPAPGAPPPSTPPVPGPPSSGSASGRPPDRRGGRRHRRRRRGPPPSAR